MGLKLRGRWGGAQTENHYLDGSCSQGGGGTSPRRMQGTAPRGAAALQRWQREAGKKAQEEMSRVLEDAKTSGQECQGTFQEEAWSSELALREACYGLERVPWRWQI